MQISFSVFDEPRFTRCDPEFADMSNPQGRMYKDVWVVQASTNYGNCYIYTGEVTDQNHANRLVSIFENQVKRGDLILEDSNEWRWVRYIYGSQAYVDNYQEAEMALMDDDELSARIW